MIESLNTPKTVVLQILKEDLGKRKFFLLYNNAPAHRLCLPIFYPKKCYNSPDLSLPDYFFFPKFKVKLKGLHFVEAAEIQEAINSELKQVQKEEFTEAFQKLYNCTEACIYANGAYFE
jgi:hypothetical protein